MSRSTPPTPYATYTIRDLHQNPVYFTVEKDRTVVMRFDKKDAADGCLHMCEEAFRAGVASVEQDFLAIETALAEAGLDYDHETGKIEKVKKPAKATKAQGASA